MTELLNVPSHQDLSIFSGESTPNNEKVRNLFIMPDKKLWRRSVVDILTTFCRPPPGALWEILFEFFAGACFGWWIFNLKIQEKRNTPFARHSSEGLFSSACSSLLVARGHTRHLTLFLEADSWECCFVFCWYSSGRVRGGKLRSPPILQQRCSLASRHSIYSIVNSQNSSYFCNSSWVSNLKSSINSKIKENSSRVGHSS